MIPPLTESGSSPLDSPDRPWKPAARRWPEPATPQGAVLYAVIAGLIVWLLIDVLSHVHIYISWH